MEVKNFCLTVKRAETSCFFQMSKKKQFQVTTLHDPFHQNKMNPGTVLHHIY